MYWEEKLSREQGAYSIIHSFIHSFIIDQTSIGLAHSAAVITTLNEDPVEETQRVLRLAQHVSSRQNERKSKFFSYSGALCNSVVGYSEEHHGKGIWLLSCLVWFCFNTTTCPPCPIPHLPPTHPYHLLAMGSPGSTFQPSHVEKEKYSVFQNKNVSVRDFKSQQC